MAMFRFPVEIGESDERDSMVRPRFEERVDSLVHIAQFSIRCLQEWRYWHHNKNKSIGRCVFYSAMSIGLSGCELESTRAEPGMRTVKDFNDHIFQTCLRSA
jgi:hypothetical protein